MRPEIASKCIRNDPETLAQWVKDYSEETNVVKIEFERQGNVWKLTVYRRE